MSSPPQPPTNALPGERRQQWAPDDRTEILEDAIDLLTQAAELVEGLHDRFLDAYVLPQLQGQDGGWLGEHAVDHLRNALHAARHPEAADA